MFDDLLTMFAWTIFLLAGVGATAHLYRNLGVLTASQASIMSVAALVDVTLVNNGMSQYSSLAVALLVGCVLGFIHLPLLLQVGGGLLLVLTAISQIVLVEVWIALPSVTGGSGGLLLPNEMIGVAPNIFLLSLIVLGCALLFKNISVGVEHFDWACLKTLGVKAGAFGVPALRLYAVGFCAYGTLLGASGVAATRMLGFLSVNSFGLTWALAVVMIVLFLTKNSITEAFLLSCLYCGIRIFLRYSTHASSTWGHIFEILFPMILLIATQIRLMHCQGILTLQKRVDR